MHLAIFKLHLIRNTINNYRKINKDGILITIFLLTINHVYGACLQAQTIAKESSELYYQKNEIMNSEQAMQFILDLEEEMTSIKELKSMHITEKKEKKEVFERTSGQVLLLIIGLIVAAMVIIANR